MIVDLLRFGPKEWQCRKVGLELDFHSMKMWVGFVVDYDYDYFFLNEKVQSVHVKKVCSSKTNKQFIFLPGIFSYLGIISRSTSWQRHCDQSDEHHECSESGQWHQSEADLHLHGAIATGHCLPRCHMIMENRN